MSPHFILFWLRLSWTFSQVEVLESLLTLLDLNRQSLCWILNSQGGIIPLSRLKLVGYGIAICYELLHVNSLVPSDLTHLWVNCVTVGSYNGVKSLPETMLTYRQLDPRKNVSVSFEFRNTNEMNEKKTQQQIHKIGKRMIQQTLHISINFNKIRITAIAWRIYKVKSNKVPVFKSRIYIYAFIGLYMFLCLHMVNYVSSKTNISYPSALVASWAICCYIGYRYIERNGVYVDQDCGV